MNISNSFGKKIFCSYKYPNGTVIILNKIMEISKEDIVLMVSIYIHLSK